ncbi:hypothetical protein DM794_03145 [Paenarthrobacter ureafaciens]|nr:hypothetical protein [Paenarthrobacter ureafaciens]
MIRMADEASGAISPAAGAIHGSKLEMLEKLGALRDRGILTQHEFETQKAEILGLE